MHENLGRIDREVRVIVGLIIGVTGIFLERWWALVGVFFLFTAMFHWCPIYALLHRSTMDQPGKTGKIHFSARHRTRSAAP